MRTQELLLGTLIGAALLGSYLTNGEYLFTMGRSFKVGEGVNTCLQLVDFLPDDIGGDMTITIIITTTFTLNTWREEDKQDPIEFSYTFFANKPNHKQCWITPGVKEKVNKYEDTYSAVASATLTYVALDGSIVEESLFEKETEIKVYGENAKVNLIQTDKPIYKPGQTVKFRVMTLDYNFIPDTVGYSQISVESPNGMRVKQWDDVTAPNGLVSLEFELSAEPILGQWKIKVTKDSTTTEQEFKVDEYVLPKFEVTITPPAYLLPTTSKVTGTVCAKYTYGQPVKGQMTLQVSYGSIYDRSEKMRPATRISEKIDGCYKFYVDADDIALANKSYAMYGQLSLSASVIEDGTGIELTADSMGPSLSNNPIKINIEDDMNSFFKPGFPYKGRVIVTNPDGSPAIGEEIEVAGFYDNEKKFAKIFQTDEAGKIYFALNDLSSDIGQLRVTASSTVYNNPRRYYLPVWRFGIFVGDGSKLVRRWYSPSDSYIYIPDTQDKLECDSEVTLDVFYTTKTSEEFTFQAIVTSGEEVVQEKQVKREFNTEPVDLNLLSISPDQVLDPYVAPPTENPETADASTPDMPILEHYEAIRKREAENDYLYRPKREASSYNITVEQGETAVLRCRVENLGTRKVVWRGEPGATVPLSIGTLMFVENPKMSIDYIEEGDAVQFNLVIKEVTKEQSGVYICQTTEKSETLLHSVNLIVTDSSPEKEQEQKVLEITGSEYVYENDPIQLRCAGTGVTQIDWFKDGNKIWPASVQIVNYEEGQMYVSMLTAENNVMFGAGNYVCRSSDYQVASKKVHVLADSSPEKEQEQKVLEITGSEYVYENDPIQLRCAGTGVTQIDWFKDGNKIWPASVQIVNYEEGQMYVSMLTAENNVMFGAGNYVCRSSDYQVASKKVHVLADSSPEKEQEQKVLEITGSEYVYENDPIQLRCAGTGVTQIDWFKDGNKIWPASVQIVNYEEGQMYVSMLTAENNVMFGAGNYVCRSSDYQVASKKVHVLADSSPEKEQEQKVLEITGSEYVYENDPIQLRCAGTGVTQIDWFKDGQKIWPASVQIVNYEEGQMYVSMLTAENNVMFGAGIYTCKSSDYQFASKKVHVLAGPGPRKSIVDHVKIPLKITESMSPSVKVLVYYMKRDGEIVAASTELKINNCFRNKASMTFNKNMALPGEDLTMKLTASPKSTCFVGMVDKSVNLLGGDKSMLSPDDLFEKVKSSGRRQFWHSNWKEDNDYCKSLEEDKPEEETDYPMYSSPTPEGADASTAFRDVGMWVITDGKYMSRPCVEQFRTYYMPFMKERGPMPDIGRPVNIAGSNKEMTVNIRSFFPETWLWESIVIGSEGEATVATTIPDTITEWVGNSLCTHPEDGVGVSPILGVTAFQPFFVSLTMPYAAVRGENLPLKVTVFNYLEKCLTMELTLVESEGFEMVRQGANKRRFCLCGGDSETTTFHIIPVIIGEVELESTAISVPDNGLCKNVILDDEYEGVSDGVQRQLLVEAEGVPQDFTHSSYVCSKGETISLVQHVIDFPEEMVPQSERATISVVGDIMGPTLSNLKNLLRMPYGCGEQNMASWSPNVYVLQYLQSTNQATEELEAEAKRYMSSGYQRQMNYRHKDNSYSAFGENSFGNATGSLWLTSFVVRTMAQSAQFVTINSEDIMKSVQWLVGKQQQNGCFPQVGKVFSSYMKGGLADGENPAGLTSFVLISLMDAELGPDYVDAISKGFSCLNSFNIDELDTYTLAVMSYAYTMQTYTQPDPNNYRRSAILNELDTRKNTESQIYWKRADEPEAVKPSWCWYRAPGAQVEMTAYILLAKLADGFSALTELQAIVQWLTQQRNSYGGFSSTQDTVVAIQALASFASLTYSEEETALMITAGGPSDDKLSFTVTPRNSLVYQTQPFVPRQGEEISATFEGSGCALVQTSLKFNIYKDLDVGPAFDVKVSVYRSSIAKRNCAQRSLDICASYLKPNGLSNMAIAEVKMLTGWEPVESTLKELLQTEAIQKYEIDKNYVQLYFDQLSSDRTCVKFDVIQEIRMNPKEAKVRVYDYYETDYTVTVPYAIKTTCGTKAEIPPDNEGLDCTIMQCRVDVPPLPDLTKSCPSCPDMLPDNSQLQSMYCNSEVVYKTIVGRSGEYPIKVKANIREKKKKHVDIFMKTKMSEDCSCQALFPPYEGKAVLFTNPYVLNKRTEELVIGDETTVFKLTKSLERKIRKMSSRGKLCDKLARLRRKAENKNVKPRSRSGRKMKA